MRIPVVPADDRRRRVGRENGQMSRDSRTGTRIGNQDIGTSTIYGNGGRVGTVVSSKPWQCDLGLERPGEDLWNAKNRLLLILPGVVAC